MSVAGSDCWVGSILVPLYDCTSGGASVISVGSDGFLSEIYYVSVFYKETTSFCSERIVATIFVWFVVCGGSSILSIQLALYFALSILLFWAARMSNRSTGAGGVSVVFSVAPSPRSFLILDMWGSFLALAAEPRIKTNFYSSSVASYYSLVSLVYMSTLVECVPLCLALSRVVKRASYSWNLFSHFCSIAVTVSELTVIHCILVVG